MYIFLADTKTKPSSQFKEWLGSKRGLCHIIEQDLTDRQKIQSIIDKYVKISAGRPLYAVFQPRSEYINFKNKIQYASSFKGIESMLITEIFRNADQTALKTKEIIAHIKYYSQIRSMKRGYNVSDIIHYIKNEVPESSLVLLIGIKNIEAITREIF